MKFAWLVVELDKVASTTAVKGLNDAISIFDELGIDGFAFTSWITTAHFESFVRLFF